MKNTKNNVKKWITIIGCLAACAVMVVLISKQFQNKDVNDELLKSKEYEIENITFNTEQNLETEIKDEELTIKTEGLIKEEKSDESELSSDEKQSIQEDVKKPEYTEEQLTNPNQKPNGEVDNDKVKKQKDAPKEENKDQDTEEKSNESNPNIEKPEGDKPGYGWFPGFGYVPDSGEGEIIEVDDMYENGNKVGDM